MTIKPLLVIVLGLTMFITLFGRRFRSHNDRNPLLVVVLGLTVIVTLFGCRFRSYNDDVLPHAVNVSSNLPCSVLPNFKK